MLYINTLHKNNITSNICKKENGCSNFAVKNLLKP